MKTSPIHPRHPSPKVIFTAMHRQCLLRAALGAMATTTAYGVVGWSGMSILSAAANLLALLFWKMTLHISAPSLTALTSS
ncbi:hypothetical protein IG605_001955 [Pectobacterium quasiaquaticum]|uniref:hypothetical protein n=1 Tax=Pectobacterium quasiaquaticum TaxID=2774015 RepID=UPI00187449C6|nr:hypothetical protein [Pectobacterium quasiaquaticum]URG53166.1 hypothetical protein IG605_001955 [Pectobacterium quasiaquaticum]